MRELVMGYRNGRKNGGADTVEEIDPIQLMIEDLGRQVAEKSIQAAEWKTRALIAEHTLATIKAEAEDEDDETDEPLDNVVELVPDGDGSQDDDEA